ncbi:MAG TPA: S9 family peptidase, partial [Microlunatus sp.]
MSEISYGSWPSPVSVEMLTASVVGLSAPAFDGDRLYWLEARPEQAGRTSLWREGPDGDPEEVTPEPWNVRSRVNEYGGGEYAVAGGVVVFSELSDGRLYVIRAGGEPQPITPTAALRYADLRLHLDRSLVLAVREDHRAPG